jgi:hypothetical protein
MNQLAKFTFSPEDRKFTRASVASIVDSDSAGEKVCDLLIAHGYNAYMLTKDGGKDFPDERSHIRELAVDGVDAKFPDWNVLHLMAVDTKTLSKDEKVSKAKAQTIVSKVVASWMTKLNARESEGEEPRATMLFEHKQADLISKRIKVLQSRRKLATGYDMIEVLGHLVAARNSLRDANPPSD